MKKYILAIVSLVCTAHTAWAQCCSGGVPMSGNVGLPASDAGSWQWMLSYDVNVLRTLKDANNTLDDDTRERLTRSWLFQMGYAISSRWALDAFFSYVRQERTIQQIGFSENFTFTQGIGDATILVKFKAATLNEGKGEWWVAAGPKVPLGASDLTDDRGIALIADLQPGSGAWDGVLWTQFSHQINWRPSLSFSSRIIARLTGKNNNYLGSQVYEFGDEGQVMASLSDQVLLGRLLLNPGVTFRLRHAGRDRTNGEFVPNSGGTFLFAAPSLGFQLTPDLSLQSRVDVPVYAQVDGTQLAPTYRVNVGILFQLNRTKQFSPEITPLFEE